jgi:hypothetical protein
LNITADPPYTKSMNKATTPLKAEDIIGIVAGCKKNDVKKIKIRPNGDLEVEFFTSQTSPQTQVVESDAGVAIPQESESLSDSPTTEPQVLSAEEKEKLEEDLQLDEAFNSNFAEYERMYLKKKTEEDVPVKGGKSGPGAEKQVQY